MRSLLVFITAAISLACSGTANTAKPNNANVTKAPPLPIYGYEVVREYPHDGSAFTQGLSFYSGSLYESTGQEGRSQLRKIDIDTGKVAQKWDLPKDEFGEGSAVLGDKIYMITWQDGIGRVHDAKDFKVLSEFSYQGEGWGLTTDGTNLIMSQGTHVLKVIDPLTFKQVKTIPVMREDGRPLMNINELEMVKGELWANIWHSQRRDILGKPNYVARIDPATGKLIGWIDLAGISPDDQPRPGREDDPSDPKSENTLNGIAYDAATERIFVTGKQWKQLYEIKLTGPKNQ